MQYTAKKPYGSRLQIQASGLCYVLEKNHLPKEISYHQITKVKLKGAFFRAYFVYFLVPLVTVGQFFIVQDQGLNFINGLNLFFWCCVLGGIVFFKPEYTLAVEKGALSAEIFVTQDKREAQEIKKTIESFLK